jgi:branched-chain amino acid transport system substrate-binding protein
MVTFVSAAQSYDSVMLVAAAIKQAGTTDGAKVAAVLESGMPDVQGIVKNYKKPFSKTDHEGLGVEDFQLGKWKDGKVTNYSDAITKALTPADLKR